MNDPGACAAIERPRPRSPAAPASSAPTSPHRLAQRGPPRASCSTTSRAPASSATCAWLRAAHGDRVEVDAGRRARSRRACARAVDGVATVFHFAAQVAVTTSLVDPRRRLRRQRARHAQRARGAARAAARRRRCVFTSTNKVYGALDDVALAAEGRALRARRRGAARARHRRGAAARLPQPLRLLEGRRRPVRPRLRAQLTACRAVVFRMSCIYGPHQFGTEDQGWVAHFLIRALARRADHHLRRRHAGARRAASSTIWSRRLLAAQQHMRALSGPGLQHRRRPGQHDQPARAARAASRSCTGRSPSRASALAHRRPALLRVRHRRFAAATGWSAQVSLRDGLWLLSAWLDGRGDPATMRVRRAVS